MIPDEIEALLFNGTNNNERVVECEFEPRTVDASRYRVTLDDGTVWFVTIEAGQ